MADQRIDRSPTVEDVNRAVLDGSLVLGLSGLPQGMGEADSSEWVERRDRHPAHHQGQPTIGSCRVADVRRQR